MVKLLVILLFVEMNKWRCLSSLVIRGNPDKFSDKFKLSATDKHDFNCDDGYCTCPEDRRTFIYGSLTDGKCVKDEDIAVQPEKGKYLPEGSKCLGVSADADHITRLNCTDDDVSIRWLWLKSDRFLNLKSLSCLQLADKNNLKLGRCNKSEIRQGWLCEQQGKSFVIKNQATFKKVKWLDSSRLKHEVYKDCGGRGSTTYEGCYRFSNASQFMYLVKNDCDTEENESCRLKLGVRAPIFAGKRKIECKFKWEDSMHSSDGKIWSKMEGNTNEFSLQKKSSEEIFLEIKKRSSLFNKWQGRLLKLLIYCEDESLYSETNCVLLKIAGSSLNTTLPTKTSVPTSIAKPTLPSRPSSTSASFTKGGSTSVPISSSSSSSTAVIYVVIPVVLFLIISLIAAVLLYRRRKRSKSEHDPCINIHQEQSHDPHEHHTLTENVDEYQSLSNYRRDSDINVYQGLLRNSERVNTDGSPEYQDCDGQNSLETDTTYQEPFAHYQPLKRDRPESGYVHVYEGLVPNAEQNTQTNDNDASYVEVVP